MKRLLVDVLVVVVVWALVTTSSVMFAIGLWEMLWKIF